MNDKGVKIKPEDIPAKRKELIDFIWKTSGFPVGKLPSSVKRNVDSPIEFLENLEWVDEIHVAMDVNEYGVAEQGLAYHFVARPSNKRLVIVPQGHFCHLDQGSVPLSDTASPGVGLQRTIHILLANGYSALAVFMPRNQPRTAGYPKNCGSPGGETGIGEHDKMFRDIHPLDGSSPMKFFLEPVPQKDRPGFTVQAYNGEYQNPPFEQINRMIESGSFGIEVAKTFSLEQAADAQRALDDHYLGKLAITLN